MNQDQISLYGNDIFGDPIEPPSKGKLFDEFTIPPFTVLNARDGFWQERKRMWQAFKIQGEIGREDNLLKYSQTASLGEKDTSIFDPVVCELVYKWFCPYNGQVIDPFAGGSVRGVIASLLGRKYWGSDLRPEQIEANVQQGREICEDQPTWVCGDSLSTLSDAPDADFVFSCPPYGDLEKYSDNPRDLSNMDYHTFIAAYNRIVLKSCKKLRNNRFACFVVGDFRDGRGFYRDFVSETIAAFKRQGLWLYNEAILVTCVGTGSMRARKQFNASKKMIKTHQNILVFVKGDPKEASKIINEKTLQGKP